MAAAVPVTKATPRTAHTGQLSVGPRVQEIIKFVIAFGPKIHPPTASTRGSRTSSPHALGRIYSKSSLELASTATSIVAAAPSGATATHVVMKTSAGTADSV